MKAKLAAHIKRHGRRWGAYWLDDDGWYRLKPICDDTMNGSRDGVVNASRNTARKTVAVSPLKPLRIGRHRMRHGNSPTWCVACGTFDVYCGVIACRPVAKEKRWWTR